MINPLADTNQNDLPKFGMTFLQAAYLHVNYDNEEFTIWQANATELQSLIGVGKSTFGCPTNSTSGSNNSSSSANAVGASNTADNSSDQGSKSSLSSGAIAGLAIGIIAAIGIGVGISIWYILRRRRQTKADQLLGGDNSTGYPREHGLTHRATLHSKPELDGSSVAVFQEPGDRTSFTKGNQDAIEMPTDRYD